MGLSTIQTVEKFEFPQSKMAPAAILKTDKSPYLRNRLTDFQQHLYCACAETFIYAISV